MIVTCASPRLPAWRCRQLGLPGDPSNASAFETAAAGLGHTPVWIFHGALDRTVPVEEARRMVAALRARGGTARYTEFPDAGHDGCSLAYRHTGLWAWLEAQHLRPETR